MPTPLDRALNNKDLFIGFAALVTAATAWSIWGQDMFPSQEGGPKGKPEKWTKDEMKQWLVARGLTTDDTETKEQLLARINRIKDNMLAPRA